MSALDTISDAQSSKVGKTEKVNLPSLLLAYARVSCLLDKNLFLILHISFLILSSVNRIFAVYRVALNF